MALLHQSGPFGIYMATNNAINLNKPVSSFQSVNNATQSNVSGDGTVYTVVYPNEIYDTANNFDATSTFTASRAGLYQFYVGAYLDQTLGVSDYYAYIIADGVTYPLERIDLVPHIGAGGVLYVVAYTMLCPMTVASTAQCFVQFSGIGKTVDIAGTGAGIRTPYFSGNFLTGLI
jgi:hypothetical protein